MAEVEPARQGVEEVEPVTLGIVIEPPLSVVNTLLEAVRRLASDMTERAGTAVVWTPPEAYAAPLATGVAPRAAAEAIVDRMRVALREAEECPVQLAPLVVEPDPADPERVLLSSRVQARGDELTALAAAAEAGLKAAGLEPEPVSADGVAIRVGVVSGTSVAVARELLGEPRDVPIAGWILGGLCVATCAKSAEGIRLPARVRFVSLKRMSGRRE